MKTETPQTIYLKDYTPPAFLVDLDFAPAPTFLDTNVGLNRASDP